MSAISSKQSLDAWLEGCTDEELRLFWQISEKAHPYKTLKTSEVNDIFVGCGKKVTLHLPPGEMTLGYVICLGKLILKTSEGHQGVTTLNAKKVFLVDFENLNEKSIKFSAESYACDPSAEAFFLSIAATQEARKKMALSEKKETKTGS